jgi:hypothetical protein
MAVWRVNRMVDLPWQSTNKRSLETVMFRDNIGLLEMAVCCAKPPYALTKPVTCVNVGCGEERTASFVCFVIDAVHCVHRILRTKGDEIKGMEGYGTGKGYADDILKCEECLKKMKEKPQDCQDPQSCLDNIHR